MRKLVLLRHGESIWNRENRFTGWIDVKLSPKGEQEALDAGQLLRKNEFEFDRAFVSGLKRAVKTLWIVLEEIDQMQLPISSSWKLNERHYGKLQGLNKTEVAEQHGKEQVHIWRRSFFIPPPPLEKTAKTHPTQDARYRHIPPENLPSGESLQDTVKRVAPYWEKEICPCFQKEKPILIVAHGNSLRALIKHIDQISDEEIPKWNIPTGQPLVYELDKKLNPTKHYYLRKKELPTA